MTEIAMARLYEIMVVLYATGIVCYFIDFFYKRVKIRRIAFWFISIVWFLQTTFFLLYIIETRRFPILSLTEGIYFYAWLLVTLSIILHCIVRVDLPVFFLNVLGFIFVTIHLFAPNNVENPLVKSLESEMLFIHISFAILSYAAFTLAFVFSVLYLVLYRILKGKKYSKLWSRLPNLYQTGKWMSYSILVGIPMLFISLLLGLEWAFLKLEGLSILDFKIVSSFIITIIYLIILVLHRSGKLTGLNFAWAQIYTFLLVVINFFLGSKLSNFHLWY
ncbi:MULTISPECIES: cytochrome c biogenesis protein CcsA [Lysinibacillus]|uniref:Cytochrome C assembly protein n=1 Tax=Lysinibacillus antri TaxID=2498145 RepID=A0A432LAU5_9BACI|nr:MULTISPECIES: cytochrome c biogenesis protein CcsA [Lysinibacillus]RUL51071.1 cytochrome C assembly protein [Lysinibacillus antri]TSI03211.1 cytochrome C assembly protein [Lysinibacillus sp. BW-2-10]